MDLVAKDVGGRATGGGKYEHPYQPYPQELIGDHSTVAPTIFSTILGNDYMQMQKHMCILNKNVFIHIHMITGEKFLIQQKE